MGKKRVVDIVEEELNPFLTENGLNLADIEFVKEGRDWFLRIYIAKDTGITLDDCQFVSEYISGRLDELDPIEQGYYLEVSSPGLDRPLKTTKDFENNRGKLIEVSLYEAVEGQKTFEGILEEFNDHAIKLSMENKKYDIERSNIAKAKPIISL